MVEEEGGKSVSLVAEVGLRAPCCKIVVHVVVVDDGGVEIGGYEIGVGHVAFLLLLPPGWLHVLCWRPDFDGEIDAEDEGDDDDDGDSCEDPESEPCWCWDFPLPAFDEALHLFLMG